MAEFDIIARYFTRPANVDLGIGDDAALISIRPGYQLAVSADMSVAGTHFFHEADPFSIGWKSMAVNISDMAAMGAEPKWATLSIALPEVNDAWLSSFSQGLFACADKYGVSLIGGDTTQGPLNIAINIFGEVPKDQALKRDGAMVGDDIWVSGVLGRAALWLQHQLGELALHENDLQNMAIAMHQPQPQVDLGIALREMAHAALDISDGLLADLGHILKASGKGARLDWALMTKPLLPASEVPLSALQQAVLAGGDDYELCFTVAPQHRQEIATLSDTLAIPVSRVGEITAHQGVKVFDGDTCIELPRKGYAHFA